MTRYEYRTIPLDVALSYGEGLFTDRGVLAARFEEQVNAAGAEGWAAVGGMLLSPAGEPGKQRVLLLQRPLPEDEPSGTPSTGTGVEHLGSG